MLGLMVLSENQEPLASEEATTVSLCPEDNNIGFSPHFLLLLEGYPESYSP